MSVLMIFRIALKALGRNKLRTALTMLGMIIGVAAVITMVALGSGAQTSIEAQIQSAGTNMIIVSAGNFSQGGVRQGQGNAATLVPDDAAGSGVPPVKSGVVAAVTTGLGVVGAEATGAEAPPGFWLAATRLASSSANAPNLGSSWVETIWV